MLFPVGYREKWGYYSPITQCDTDVAESRHGRGAIAEAKKYKQTPFEVIRVLFGDTDSLDVLIE